MDLESDNDNSAGTPSVNESTVSFLDQRERLLIRLLRIQSGAGLSGDSTINVEPSVILVDWQLSLVNKARFSFFQDLVDGGRRERAKAIIQAFLGK